MTDEPPALLLIAHGSRFAAANDDLRHVADQLRTRGYPVVVASYLELCEPDIDGGGAQCVEAGAARVVMVPYFLSPGTHVRRDLTAARDRLTERFPGVLFSLAEPIGRHPLMIEIVRDRVKEATAHDGNTRRTDS